MGRALIGWLTLALALTALLAQEKPRKDKPKLIRNDRITEPAEPEVITPDPKEARRHIEVGDFYLKRGNLKAARERYREAVRYGPTLAEGYEKLVETLEQMEDWQGALEACREFLSNNPQSNEVREFQEKAQRLEEKLG